MTGDGVKWANTKVGWLFLIYCPSFSSVERNAALCQHILLPVLHVELLFSGERDEQEQEAYLITPIHFLPHNLGKACRLLMKDHTRKAKRDVQTKYSIEIIEKGMQTGELSFYCTNGKVLWNFFELNLEKLYEIAYLI